MTNDTLCQELRCHGGCIVNQQTGESTKYTEKISLNFNEIFWQDNIWAGTGIWQANDFLIGI